MSAPLLPSHLIRIMPAKGADMDVIVGGGVVGLSAPGDATVTAEETPSCMG